jgi:hypothetical protein
MALLSNTPYACGVVGLRLRAFLQQRVCLCASEGHCTQIITFPCVVRMSSHAVAAAYLAFRSSRVDRRRGSLFMTTSVS